MKMADVAKRANVSTATVSRVLSGSSLVTKETTTRVQEVVAKLGYVPDTTARMLSMGRSRLFGIVVSDIRNPFYPDLLLRFNELAEQHQYRAIFANADYSAARLESSLYGMIEQNVEGIAVMTPDTNPDLTKMFSDRGSPMVILNESITRKDLSSVIVDYKSGISEAIDHLLALGHTQFAYIGGPDNPTFTTCRQTMIMQSLFEKGILNNTCVTAGNHRIDGGYSAMRRILQNHAHITALLTCDDLTAIGAIGAIREAGLNVPDDISVVGYEDIAISASFNPPLTTVSVSRFDIATRAFYSLYSASNQLDASCRQHQVCTHLIIRKTTAPPPMR